MPSCLLLTPFPLVKPRHGGQVRAASMMAAIRLAGWHTESVGIFPAALFPPEEWGPLDIVLDSPRLREKIFSDMVFGDFHAARIASQDRHAVERFRMLIRRLNPDVIQVEHPWSWLVLREALPSSHDIRIIYSSHNIEWLSREGLLRIGMQNAGSDQMLEATRLLEEEFARTADLVLSISDIESEQIRRTSGREIIYLPAVSDLASAERLTPTSRFAAEVRANDCRYAALMGSAYWPNVEGFFSIFSEGLGFLAQGEQIWVAGTLGNALKEDKRFRDFLSINETRSRAVGYIDNAEKAEFFAAAECAIVPVTFGGGAKLKTADAIASGLPVITTQHAIDGYGPVVTPAIGKGVYIAETSREFRGLVREALRGGLPGCAPEVRSQLSIQAMSKAWSRHVDQLMGVSVSS